MTGLPAALQPQLPTVIHVSEAIERAAAIEAQIAAQIAAAVAEAVAAEAEAAAAAIAEAEAAIAEAVAAEAAAAAAAEAEAAIAEAVAAEAAAAAAAEAEAAIAEAVAAEAEAAPATAIEEAVAAEAEAVAGEASDAVMQNYNAGKKAEWDRVVRYMADRAQVFGEDAGEEFCEKYEEADSLGRLDVQLIMLEMQYVLKIRHLLGAVPKLLPRSLLGRGGHGYVFRCSTNPVKPHRPPLHSTTLTPFPYIHHCIRQCRL